MKTKYAILAIPPKSGIFSDLKLRLQMWNNGSIVEYDSEKDAQEYCDICNQSSNGWIYIVKNLLIVGLI